MAAWGCLTGFIVTNFLHVMLLRYDDRNRDGSFLLNHFIRLSRDENHTLYNTKIDLQSLEIQREDSCKKIFWG